MKIQAKCAGCGAKLNVKPDLVGGQAVCPNCHESRRIIDLADDLDPPPEVFGAADLSALILVILMFPAALGAMGAFYEFGLWGGLSIVLSITQVLLLGAIVVLLLQIKASK